MRKYQYPKTCRQDVVENWFGTELADPYAWLKDARSPETLEYVRQQNAFTDAYFRQLPVEEKIKQLKQEIPPQLPSAISPWKDGFIGTCITEGNYEVWILDEKLQKKEQFCIPEALKDLDLFEVSPDPCDPGILAMMMMRPGAARPTVVVYSLTLKSVLKEIDMSFSYCWSKADGCLYYSITQADAQLQTSRSQFLRFNPRTGEESVVFEDDTNVIFGQVHASEDGGYVQMMLCRDYALAAWYCLHVPTGQVLKLTETPKEWEYIDSVSDRHYFVSMTEHPYGAVICVDGQGEQLIFSGSREMILEKGFSAGGRMFVLAKHDVSSRLLDAMTAEEIPIPSPYASLEKAGRFEGGVFLKYETFLCDPMLLAFDGQELKEMTQPEKPADPAMVVEQHFAPSTEDGTLIPYYLVYKKDTPRDGRRPALLYAYGGYNIGMPPWSREMVTEMSIPGWVAAGGIYVHLNIRGGNEYGPAWHEDGMGMNKRHCYEDFIGIAEELIAQGWTSKGKIGITGCSNGGLLMSALVTMRPDLWGCVIDSVPHTDMIHFAEDDRGPMYITEYGNPRESKEMFEYLLSYSPYHNVREMPYPPTYIQTGEMDNNVPPCHGKKLAARMQELNTSDSPVLLRVLAEGSHDRGKGEVFWRTIAEMQLFLEEHLYA